MDDGANGTRAGAVGTGAPSCEQSNEADVVAQLNDVWRKHAREILERCTAWSGGRADEGREAFSRAWSHAVMSAFADRPQLVNARAWLLTLAYRACMDLHRERARRGEEGLDVTRAAVHDPATQFHVVVEDPERIALAKELNAFLLTAVEQLPKRLRDTMLTYMSSGDYRDVVERFGITEVNARKRIQQARAILRERLGDYRSGRTPRRRL